MSPHKEPALAPEGMNPSDKTSMEKASKGKSSKAKTSKDKSSKEETGEKRRYAPALRLRTTLVIIVVLVSGLGLSLSAAAVSGIMRDFLYARADREVQEAVYGWAGRSDFVATKGGPPTELYVAQISTDGTMTVRNDNSSTPDIDGVQVGNDVVTVPAAEGSASNSPWRAVAFKTTNGVTIVARSLEKEEIFLKQLLMVQLGIGALVLLGLGLVALISVRRALRPLREVEKVAVAISDGHYDRRVPEWPLNTEVGQLSYALNIMLEKLQASLQEALDNEEQMRRFVGDASHELRTPLTSVRGYTELYRSGAAPDADWVIGKIAEEAGRMTALVEDLLDLARSEGNKLQLQNVDLLELALSVVTSLKAAHPGRDIKVLNECGDIPFVTGDSMALRRVIINLVNNALVHAGKEASVTVALRPGGQIAIIDNGVGMSPEDAQHVFERFYRTDTSRSRESGGSGLGLAIVKSLVESHKGTVSVESELGKGSTFTVTLPV
ncbi:MAG: HAMP domain-containing sensor histidine kinase [Corynebacterium sp.]|nr:HAMP domain-containing sensor histidine kinase [Corynebacterium sp.]